MLSVQPLNADKSLIRGIGPWALTAFAINMTVGAGRSLHVDTWRGLGFGRNRGSGR